MKGQVYRIEGMQWKVIKLMRRRNVEWARLKCLDKPKTHKSTTLDFLRMIEKRQRIS
ncbi:hypothetical protein [Brevibacillus nitrificans]|uniref:hypothetical protein n=1 Tax=Brevibacillus nitrificans TaxID=651560 RepID=UPI0028652D2D|nr:hypothetical protein [Brevibacillus nitrificans]MDR7318884.1 hypothetical protein [Brevibacillus nitrificans]